MSGWAAAAGAIAQGVAGIGSTIMSNSMNRRAQKRDIAHQEHMFDEVNLYNSPLEQRRRMEAAGFNPNAIFGNGAIAGQASQPSPIVSKPVIPLDLGGQIGGAISTYNDLRMKDQSMKAGEQNIQVQKDQSEADLAVKASTVGKNQADTARTNWERERGQELMSLSKDTMQEALRGQQLRNIEQEITNSGKTELQNLALREGAFRILQAKSNIGLQSVEKALRETELKLRQVGLSPNDPAWQRILLQTGGGMVKNFKEDFKKWGKEVDESSFGKFVKKANEYNPLNRDSKLYK